MAYLVQPILNAFKAAQGSINSEHPDFVPLGREAVLSALTSGCNINCPRLSGIGKRKLVEMNAFSEDGSIRPELQRSAQLFARNRLGPGVGFKCQRTGKSWIAGRDPITQFATEATWTRTKKPMSEFIPLS